MEQSKKCPNCNKDIASDATICPHCGHHLKIEKNLEVVLKRAKASYLLDILIMILPLSLIALTVINNYILIFSIPVAIICMIWGILSLKKRKKNNVIIKDLIYLNKSTNEIVVFTLENREHTYPINLIEKIHKENFLTQRVYITIKELNEDHITYHTYKLDLGYADTKEVKEAEKKLKNLIKVDITIEE